MKKISNILDSARKHFEEDGKMHFMQPLFEATETFFFIPGDVTKKSPHIRDSLDLKRFMSIVLLAVTPLLLWGIFNAGVQNLLRAGKTISIYSAFIQGSINVIPIVIVSYSVGFFWETIFSGIRKHKISEGFLITGILFPLTLPPTTPLWQVALGISFGVVIGKEIFGGTGRNFLNPALTGRAFLFFAYPSSMSGSLVWTTGDMGSATVDAISSATPLYYVDSLSTALNTSTSAALWDAGYSFMKLFVGLYPGSIGETSTLLCVIGALILIITGVANYRIIAGGIIGVLCLGFFLNFFNSSSSSAWFSLNPFYHLVMGGFAFGITFMATDPVSAPGTNSARWIYGFMIGALTILVRVFNPAYPDGVMLSILFMNLFAPLIDYFAIEMKLKKRVPNV